MEHLFSYQTMKNGYLLLIGGLLLLSYLFYIRSQFDERKRKRFKLLFFNHHSRFYKQLKNEQYDRFFRSNGLPSVITSERFNLVRLTMLVSLIAVAFSEILFRIDVLSFTNTIILGSIPLMMIPKKPYPFYYLVLSTKKRYKREKNNEVYQLYNEVKAEFKAKGNHIGNSYFLILDLIPYYTYIRPTLEKMLPLLENKNFAAAWDLFAEEIETPEAERLSVLMKEIESTGIEQASVLLEQARQEFANNMYNTYKDYLTRRKNIIYFIVVIGAVTVFLNEFAVFFLWYKDIMSVVNGLGQ